MRSLTISLLLLCAVAARAFERVPFDALVRETREETFAAEGGDLKYRIYLSPGVLSSTNRVPLVLFLHGSGECGTNNVSQLVHGVGSLVGWCRAKKQSAIIVAPQAPFRTCWSPVFFTDEQLYAAPRRPLPLVRALDGLLVELVERYPVDRNRLLLTGISLGGYGVWDLVTRYPGRFAAAMPVCGCGNPLKASDAARTPLWIFHGERDGNVPNRFDRKMVSRLWELDAPVRYAEYPDSGHGIWDAVYSDEKVLAWFFKQSRKGRK